MLDLAIALVAGFLYALLVMGPRPLNPRNVNWIAFDPAYHYIGWELYRQDPHVHWPLTYTDRLGYPEGESVALLDLNPLMAVVLKRVSFLLPEPAQYFGLEVILVCTLQFFFAFRLLRMMVEGRREFAPGAEARAWRSGTARLKPCPFKARVAIGRRRNRACRRSAARALSAQTAGSRPRLTQMPLLRSFQQADATLGAGFGSWNVLAAALGAGFFLLAPPLNYRFWGHYSLSNQWLLVAALYVFARAQESNAECGAAVCDLGGGSDGDRHGDESVSGV